MQEKIITSPEAMFEFGALLAKEHKILLLKWELGAGKTLLSKGFASWLGIDPEHVQSPTYTYINIYDDKLLHLDLYRITDLDEMTKKGIFDEIHQFDHICIERPKYIEYLDLPNYLEIQIEKLEEGRKLILTEK